MAWVVRKIEDGTAEYCRQTGKTISWVPTTANCLKFHKQESAMNFVFNTLVDKVDKNTLKKVNISQIDEADIVTESCYNQVSKNDLMNLDECEEKLNRLRNALHDIYEILPDIYSIRTHYDTLKLMSEIRIQDILHYIEFDKLSVTDGYKLAKMLQETRQARRKYADNYEYASMLIDSNIISSLQGSRAAYQKYLTKIEERSYNPRVIRDPLNKFDCYGSESPSTSFDLIDIGEDLPFYRKVMSSRKQDVENE